MTDSKPLRLLHISDLHFGRIEDRVLLKLEDYITNENNLFHLAILTGDLTQRARSAQFIAAKEFLAKLKCPLFLVPGNHDVPLYNPFIRFFNPYSKFKRFFGSHAPRYYEDDHLAVYGLWTVDNLSIKDATIDADQINEMESKFKAIKKEKLKLIAFHHPLQGTERSRIERALARIREMKPHIMMWGHDHKARAGHWDKESQKGPLMIAAGTSVSSRTREETNSFNIIEVVDGNVQVRVIAFNSEAGDFHETKCLNFSMTDILS